MKSIGTNKVLLSTLALVFGTLLLFSCTRKVVSDYYLIHIQMPRLVDGAYGLKATQPEIDVEHLRYYESDSAAIASETERSDRFIADIPKSCERDLREQIKASDSEYIRSEKERIIVEVYEELLERKTILLRVSHVEGADLREYLKLVRTHGLNSEKVRRYAIDNQFDVFTHTIKD